MKILHYFEELQHACLLIELARTEYSFQESEEGKEAFQACDKLHKAYHNFLKKMAVDVELKLEKRYLKDVPKLELSKEIDKLLIQFEDISIRNQESFIELLTELKKQETDYKAAKFEDDEKNLLNKVLHIQAY